jgi:ligand-binding sensor domain-containing protein
MMRCVKSFALLLLIVFCSFCNAQNKTELPTGITNKSEIKEVISSHGPTTSVRTIMQDRKGNMWLASNEGIIRYDARLNDEVGQEKSFTNITGELTSSRFFSVLEDRKGNFWFGNYGSGLYYYDGKSFQHFTTKEGLVNDRVSIIYEDRTGNIWFGTYGGVSRYDGKSFLNFSTKEGFSITEVMTIIEDKTGKFWFGTRGNTFIYDGRLPHGQGKTFTVFTHEGEPVTNVWSIIEDKKGNMWLGGNGLWRYDGNTFTNLTKNSVRYVYEDKKGNIWTSGVIDRSQRFVLSVFDAKSLSDEKPTVTEITQSLNLFGILEVNDGSIWFGAFDGVYRYDGKTITDFKRQKDQ